MNNLEKQIARMKFRRMIRQYESALSVLVKSIAEDVAKEVMENDAEYLINHIIVKHSDFQLIISDAITVGKNNEDKYADIMSDRIKTLAKRIIRKQEENI